MRRPVPFKLHQPRALATACELKHQLSHKSYFLAGGTDLVIAVKEQGLSPDSIIDLKRIPDLAGVADNADGSLTIGALTTLAEIESSATIVERYPFLAQAAGEVGSLQIRNRATIGGNIANASPSADTIPSLMAMNASLRVSDGTNQRSSTFEDFLLGPGQTALRDGEILTAVVVPPTDGRLRGEYIKLSPRHAMDLAIVGVAVTLVTDEQRRVEAAAIALGAVAPTPIRARTAEAHMLGRVLEEDLAEAAGAIGAEECSPIDDVRSSADYRREMVRVLIKRALLNAAARAPGPIPWRQRGRKRH